MHCLQVLTQEKAAIKIQAGVRGLLTRRRVHRTALEELQFIGMKPKVSPCFQWLACLMLDKKAPTICLMLSKAVITPTLLLTTRNVTLQSQQCLCSPSHNHNFGILLSLHSVTLKALFQRSHRPLHASQHCGVQHICLICTKWACITTSAGNQNHTWPSSPATAWHLTCILPKIIVDGCLQYSISSCRVVVLTALPDRFDPASPAANDSAGLPTGIEAIRA